MGDDEVEAVENLLAHDRQRSEFRVDKGVPEADVVVVAYNGGDQLREAVHSILASRNVNLRVIVVDNASTDGSVGTLEDLPVSLVRLATNLGYGGGFNAGLAHGRSPWVVCANQDIVVHPDTLSRLIDTAAEAGARLRSAVIAAPRLVAEDGSTVETAHQIPSFGSECLELLFGTNRNRSVVNQATDEPAHCGWVSAVFLVGPRTVFEVLGGFDASYFMYVEDLDFFRRLRDVGGVCIWDPRATVQHEGGVDTAVRGTYPGLLYALTLWNIRRYFEKHEPGRARLCGPAILAAGTVGATMRALLWLSRALRGRIGKGLLTTPGARRTPWAGGGAIEGSKAVDAVGLSRMFGVAALCSGFALVTGHPPGRVRRLAGVDLNRIDPEKQGLDTR